MVNQQVYIERSTINNQGYLAANKGEAAAEFKEEVAEAGEQSSLQLPLREWLSEGQEVKIVRIAQDLLGHIGARKRQGTFEVGEGLPFPLVKLPGDHVNQDILTPAVLQRCSQVPLARRPDPSPGPKLGHYAPRAIVQ
jgi:hypothetical protein